MAKLLILSWKKFYHLETRFWIATALVNMRKACIGWNERNVILTVEKIIYFVTMQRMDAHDPLACFRSRRNIDPFHFYSLQVRFAESLPTWHQLDLQKFIPKWNIEGKSVLLEPFHKKCCSYTAACLVCWSLFGSRVI